ncbi:MAG: hypothetical protein C4B59_07020 [Candidatus Methanogaster sp.]|uniref:Uncharacterized protein n=1 Tax=Candidatus Methanogaster sp. TaxID=3386292 RepID=A0AC61L373_9EURY|nr:MAG: hypothetical protein C4B59_07020 [ANME-2 cluster archaeon]
MRAAIELALPKDVKLIISSSEHTEKDDSRGIFCSCIEELNREIREYGREIAKVSDSECSMEKLVQSVNSLCDNYRKEDRD